MSGNGWHAGLGGFEIWLRERSDAQLAALLAARPDLVTPVPADLGALASRAVKRLSLERAVDDLDQFSLQVIEALLALPAPVPTRRLEEALGAPPQPLIRCLASLCARALAWHAGGGFRPAPGLRAVIGEPRAPASAGRVSPIPPTLDGIPNGVREVNQAASAAALNALRWVEDLLSRWAAAPPPVLRSGGLGIRELRKAAAAIGADLTATALLTEVARAARLLAASSWAAGAWLPTCAFDAWLDSAHADRWAMLVEAWLATTRVPSLVGSRDDGGRLLNALGVGLDRVDAPRVRAKVLGELAAAPPGTCVGVKAMLTRLAWLWPRGPQASRAMLAEAAMREAALLGLTGLGGLSAPGRAAISGKLADAAAVLAGILPEPVGYVLLQADLTAVAPGLLTPGLARELSLAADVESTDAATVYRFSPASVQRAMDAGLTAAGLLTMLAERARTPVPQPLRYLVEDVGRRHGRIRVGTASAYIRCEDPAVAAEIAADRRAAPLRLRLLAPTVLVSSARRGDLLAALRRLGYAPAAESAEGTVEFTVAPRRADRAFGPAATSGPLQPSAPWPAEERALAAVRLLRADST